ncbi:MAG TPA: substrate-binding domain-containing protein [Egibacteraceae bacterium]|nr:substrate-binding domain-containing protein [Egibacteraceae bacterium]
MIVRAAAAVVALLALAAGCAPAAGTADEPGPRIALLLPESKTARYEAHDRPAFEERVRRRCPACTTIYSNANQDGARQQAQAEAALTNGADVLVLDPVDSVSSAVIVRAAAAAGVPVITYDRMVLDVEVDFHVTFDNERVGELQAAALLEAIAADDRDDGVIVMLNGAPTDDNARLLITGAHRVLDPADVRIGAEFDIPDWSPDKAQEQMERALATIGRDRVIGVYAANDGIAGGAVAAMKAGGVSPLPPITGQDAELAAIQRILVGEQHMTVYKAIRSQAAVAADAAIALALHGAVPPSLATDTVFNGSAQVPAHILSPAVVTRSTIAGTVIADGLWSAEDICTGRFRAACSDAGISQ